MENQQLLSILLWTGAISGSILMILMLGSILFGLDLDIDFDSNGLFKTILTFLTIGSFTVRAFMINTDYSLSTVLCFGIVSGIVAVLVLGMFIRLLLKYQESGNWAVSEALHKEAEVYIPIPEHGIGKVSVEINGVMREVEAISHNGQALATNDKVLIIEVLENSVVVTKM